MAPEVRLEPVGRVAGGRDEVRDDGWGPVRAVLELDPVRFGPEAVAGLEAFSHLEVVFLFDRVEEPAVETGARHPRGNAAWPRVGIFAQRAKDRPNRLGVSRCRLLSVDGLPRVARGGARGGAGGAPRWRGRRCSTSSRGWRSSPRRAPSVSRPGPASSWRGTGRTRPPDAV